MTYHIALFPSKTYELMILDAVARSSLDLLVFLSAAGIVGFIAALNVLSFPFLAFRVLLSEIYELLLNEIPVSVI